jgi:hypothetical protein
MVKNVVDIRFILAVKINNILLSISRQMALKVNDTRNFSPLKITVA